MNVGRYRDFDVADMPPALAAVLGIGLIALFVVLIWTLMRLDHTKLRDPRARARAKRREASQKRQGALRARREALQRKAARRGRADS
ncbi:hypothetical protein [Streptomyces sp. PT12]|uniref:hypothetical protein n=1 Tax=Streptomyces sp. PT12 TaxID=1510197 RepID=UPI000DE2B816|nr:hypothetical protein [Streptomyces sp. PT12]RBM16893.1 hypothetical protein DEH69_16330 [Streptomyces sp. PT12]